MMPEIDSSSLLAISPRAAIGRPQLAIYQDHQFLFQLSHIAKEDIQCGLVRPTGKGDTHRSPEMRACKSELSTTSDKRGGDSLQKYCPEGDLYQLLNALKKSQYWLRGSLLQDSLSDVRIRSRNLILSLLEWDIESQSLRLCAGHIQALDQYYTSPDASAACRVS